MASLSQRTGKPELGKRLVGLREAAKLSRTDLAKRAGIAYSFLSGIETGYRAPSAKVLTALAAALEISLDHLTLDTELASPAGESTPSPMSPDLTTRESAGSTENAIAAATDMLTSLPAPRRLEALAEVQKRVMEDLLSRL